MVSRHSILFLLALFSLAPVNRLAAEAAAPKPEAKTIQADVEGMVCEFCAKSLRDTLTTKTPVSEIAISVDSGIILLLEPAEKKVADADIRKWIESAGFKVTGVRHLSTPFPELKEKLDSGKLTQLTPES